VLQPDWELDGLTVFCYPSDRAVTDMYMSCPYLVVCFVLYFSIRGEIPFSICFDYCRSANKTDVLGTREVFEVGERE
jgi:hypothetical protein